MRNQWRVLLQLSQRHNICSVPRISRQVSSSLQRFYCSQASSKLPQTCLLIDIFSKPHNDFKSALDSNSLVLTPDLISDTFKHLHSQPDVAINLFHWLSHTNNYTHLLLDSNSYNSILPILASNAHVSLFWDTLHLMKTKGFGIKRASYDLALDQFSHLGFTHDVLKLKDLFLKKDSHQSSSTKILRILKRDVSDETVDTDLKALSLSYSTPLVQMVLEKLAITPTKAFFFFTWLHQSSFFNHDHLTYNTMAVVLAREDSIQSFWNVVEDMRTQGYEMEIKTFVKVLERFIDRRMMEDVVRLYEFAMDGSNKPSRQDCTFVLKKLAVAKEDLHMDLFSRVIKAFTQKGFALDDCMLDSVLKSLTSVGRIKECNNVLDVMVQAGFSPSGKMKARVAYDLSSSKQKDQADGCIENLEGLGLAPDYQTWSSLIERHCAAGDFDKAKDCLYKMIEKEEVRYIGHPLNMLVNAYCGRYRGAEACKLLLDVVNNYSKIEPWHLTYKTLITKLTDQKGFVDALPLLGLMKKHGFPPYVDPFITYLSKKGTTEEAMQFLKAVTVKKHPSTTIYVRVFEAYSKSGRHKKAQDLLLKCPPFIRNNADVLNIFCCMKSEKPAEPELASVAA